MKRLTVGILIIVAITSFVNAAQDEATDVVHPTIGTAISSNGIELRLEQKIQNIAGGQTQDNDIMSPKSVKISIDGNSFFINSLEGYRTVAYNLNDYSKLFVINHEFTQSDSILWHQGDSQCLFGNTQMRYDFKGKPVESALSHGGKYLWVPYYRRSYDANATMCSAIAVIDLEQAIIVRMFTTSVLPKMIACSQDNHYIAVSHWGDNTVGLIDISSENPQDWCYSNIFTVDYRFEVTQSSGKTINRDIGSGYCLRGTSFTPNDEYLLVGCMGGAGGIAVIDVRNEKYLGRLVGIMPNVRHLLFSGDYLYLSINADGYIQRIPIEQLYQSIESLKEGTKKTCRVQCSDQCKVGAGARTISISPDGRWLFAACNSVSAIYVVDTYTMQVALHIPADSYPVGMDISPDGNTLIVTSQGKHGEGGNSVDIYKIIYHDVR